MILNMPPITILMSVGLGMGVAGGEPLTIEQFSYTEIRAAVTRTEAYKVCSDCGVNKPISHFPLKSAKTEITVRWDKRCRPCKSRSMTRASARVATQPTRAKEIIEPKKVVEKVTKPSIFEETRIVSTANFDDLNRFYDIKLTDREKHEVVERFNAFVSTLREGLGEKLGCKVYVKAE